MANGTARRDAKELTPQRVRLVVGLCTGAMVLFVLSAAVTGEWYRAAVAVVPLLVMITTVVFARRAGRGGTA